jgi:hypothetical protein
MVHHLLRQMYVNVHMHIYNMRIREEELTQPLGLHMQANVNKLQGMRGTVKTYFGN